MRNFKKNKKVLIICPYPIGVAPGQRLKYEQYFNHWESNGYKVKVSSFMSLKFWNIVYKNGFIIQKVLYTILGYIKRIYDILRAPFYDSCYVFLWVTPFGVPLFEWFFVQFARKYIYDIDDMVFLGHASRANSFLINIKGKSKMIFLMKHASHVITCTPFLDKFVKRFNKNTTDISSTINTDIYKPKLSYLDKSIINLGWSGSHSTSKYLHLLDRVLKEISNEFYIRLIVIGDSKFEIEGVDINAIDWRLESEVEDLSKIDIGLYPLPNEEWVYGKSGLKALQYMSLGIPTIATNIGANKRIISNEEDGFLVNSESEWKSCLVRLIKNRNLRERVGIQARHKVEQLFSVEVNKSKYIKVLKEIEK